MRVEYIFFPWFFFQSAVMLLSMINYEFASLNRCISIPKSVHTTVNRELLNSENLSALPVISFLIDTYISVTEK